MTELKKKISFYEKTVICILMTYPNSYYKVQGLFKPELFSVKENIYIATVIVELAEAGKPTDVVAILDALEKKNYQPTTDEKWMYYLGDIAGYMVGDGNLEYYIVLLSQRHLRRTLAQIGEWALKSSKNPEADVFDSLEELTAKIYEAQSSFVPEKTTHVKDFADEFLTELKFKRNTHTSGELTGIPSGIIGLDLKTDGWQDGDVIVVAANPGAGKTALIGQCCIKAAENEKPAKMDSIEMLKDSIFRRMIVNHCGVSNSRMKRGNVDDGELQLIEESIHHFKGLPIYIDDSSSVNIGQIKVKARKAKALYNIGIMFIDYLQLISAGKRSKGKLNEDVSYVIKEIKALAKELKIPILIISTLTKEAMKDGDKRPNPGHLKESGDIWYAADIVITLYRPEEVGIKTFKSAEHGDIGTDGLLVIDLWKQKDGSVGEILARFFPAKMKITDWSNMPAYPIKAVDFTKPQNENEDEHSDLPF